MTVRLVAREQPPEWERTHGDLDDPDAVRRRIHRARKPRVCNSPMSNRACGSWVPVGDWYYRTTVPAVDEDLPWQPETLCAPCAVQAYPGLLRLEGVDP